MSRLLSRRRLFQMGLLGGMGLTTYAVSYWWNKISNRSPLLLSQKPFQIPLKIPPVLEPVRRDTTTDYYELEIRRSQVNYWHFYDALPSTHS
jgi:spore coat protein A, manganese oxidase